MMPSRWEKPLARKSAFPSRIIAVACLVAGAGLVFWGFQKSEGLNSQVSDLVTGSPSDNVMMLYIGGAICLAIGAALLFRR